MVCGVILARTSKRYQIDGRYFPAVYFADIAEMLHFRQTFCGYPDRERLNLADPDRCNAMQLCGKRKSS